MLGICPEFALGAVTPSTALVVSIGGSAVPNSVHKLLARGARGGW